ncbi:DUF3783 domain-containing protein [Aminipila terrae]|uniref:DUF3783 domain-containing protein n=1 Tax=Aminipila terrae TaxID=2697030 RepID=A0A6P1MCP0_9FIRM|nr:DUF3783 domain-containing protein [Aminipila terrae]QHI71667.1 DUF3783 domain-containing protein [Aminipila terrae]
MRKIKSRAIGFMVMMAMVPGLIATPAFSYAADDNGKLWDILNNCFVALEKEGSFTEADKEVSVSATLDQSIKEVYMTVFAYPGNVAFDPDSTANKRLFGGYMKNGQTVRCEFNSSLLPLKKGWKVIATLNVPVGDDNYRQVLSKSVAVVDESGESTPEYTWPDASILDKELKEGDSSAHLKLTGDERLFKNKNIEIHYCVYQYPKEDKFDFENNKMIPLYSSKADEAFDSKEIKFLQPLKPGYRVRAVAYWTQDYDSFIPKSNDYEFGQPDDSVLIQSKVAIPAVSIATSDVKVGADVIRADIGGTVPEGSILIFQSYPKNETYKFGAGGNGLFVANKSNITAGTGQVISVTNKDNLKEGRKLIAVIIKSGEVIAQSAPVDIVSSDNMKPFVLKIAGDVYEGDKEVTLKVDYDDAIADARLLIHEDKGESSSPDLDEQIANVALSKNSTGQITVLLNKPLESGKKLAASIYYCKPGTNVVYLYHTTNQIIIKQKKTEPHISIINTQFTKDDVSADIQVDGCDEFMGGQIIICQYSSSKGNFDPDSSNTKRLYQGNITTQGTFTYEFKQNLPLTSGNKIIAYLYKYDSVTDSIRVKYSEPVSVISDGGEIIPAKVQMATSNVKVGDTGIWVISNFDSKKKNGRLIIYSYKESQFVPSSANNIILYNGITEPSESSKKINFINDKLPLKEGWKLKAALILTDKESTTPSDFEYSESVQVQSPPVLVVPTVTINEKEITEGDNKMRISITYDKNIKNPVYTVYQYEGNTLDKEASSTKVLNSGTASKWSKFPVNFSTSYTPLKPGNKIIVVLTVTTDENKEMEYNSNVLTIGPRPNWATPTAAFDVNSIKVGAVSVPMTVTYDEGYYSLDEFYCNVTLYQYPAYITDFDHEEKYAEPVGAINGSTNKPVSGKNIQIPINKPLKAGYRLIAKLRLPHAEWEGEEADYLSAPVSIIDENEKQEKPLVLLYQLGEDTSRGSRIRAILKNLDIEVKNIEKTQINETIGYLAGMEGFGKSEDAYNGDDYTTEFIIMNALSESKLDAFLHAMMSQNLRIEHKAAVTDTNKNWTFRQLVGDIGEENEVFVALLELGKLAKEGEKLDIKLYDTKNAVIFREALENAHSVLRTHEPDIKDIKKAIADLKKSMLDLTGQKELTGRVVLTCTKVQEKYAVKASVVGAPKDATFAYLWSNGGTGDTLEGMDAEALAGVSVTVTGTDSYWGSLSKAQLKTAKSVKNVKVTPENNKIKVSWFDSQDEENTPDTLYVAADIYDGKSFLKTVRLEGGEKSLEIDGLKNEKQYDIKLYSVNIIGRSDMIIVKGKPGESSSQSSGPSHRSKKSNQKAKSDVSGNQGKQEQVTKEKKTRDEKQSTVKDNTFKDLDNHWAKDTITLVTEKGLFNGTSNQTFSPDTQVTRAMFVTALGRLAEADVENYQNPNFLDVERDSYYEAYVNWAKDIGIITGFAGKFNPNEKISRQDMAVILSRYMERTNKTLQYKQDSKKFTDENLIADYAQDAVIKLQEAGIINGKNEKNFAPKDTATRAEAAKIIAELIKKTEK